MNAHALAEVEVQAHTNPLSLYALSGTCLGPIMPLGLTYLATYRGDRCKTHRCITVIDRSGHEANMTRESTMSAQSNQ